jgi:hypothetical protein
MLMSGMAWLRNAASRARHSLAVAVGAGVVIAILACGALPAEGETGPPSESGKAVCPPSNPPNVLTLMAGTPQSATRGSAFATNLQVTLTNSNGCPLTTAVAGIPVTFSAPSAGASGLFSASGSSSITVGSDASGTVAAPAFTANDVAGSYTVTASSAYGSVSFSLMNTGDSDLGECGAVSSAVLPSGPTPASLAPKPTKLTPGVGVTQSTPTGAHFPVHLAVTVTDAEKKPVPDVLVTFAAPNRGPSGYFTVRSGGAHTPISLTPTSDAYGSHSPHSRPHWVEVETNACGIALAPTFTANGRAGGYIVVASVEHVKAAFALVNEGR